MLPRRLRTLLPLPFVMPVSLPPSLLAIGWSPWILLPAYREPVAGEDQFLRDGKAGGGMAGVVNDHELGSGPDALELPRVTDWRLEVKASVHHDPWDIDQRGRAAKQASVLQPRVVADVMGQDAGEGEGEGWVREPIVQFGTRRPFGCGGLPLTPGFGGLLTDPEVGIIQQSVICLDDIVMRCSDRQPSPETVPLLGEENGCTPPEPPVKLRASSGCDAPQDHLRGPIRMGFRVGECQRAPP